MRYSHRDVDFIKLNQDQYLTIACDSCGAIGLKENDIVRVPYSITGKYTARVCLMEIISIGAKPVGLTVNICNEPTPTGNEIIGGIEDELSEAGLDIPLTISTEKNMPTTMTALGITAIGLINKNDILLKDISRGDYVYSIGIPSIGNEVLENQELICNIKILNNILAEKGIKEVIPVGSAGIMGEIDKLCRQYCVEIQPLNDLHIDIYKSAGPCTVIIIISKNKLNDAFEAPINLIGRIL
ncbi:MAG: alpha-ribazole kinase [Maledivibacter sp.]|jgi:hypothetical protein|nr:alpha-ribazole kinase [Maledivibacter sp.]